MVTVRELPPVVVEDRPEREVAPEVIYDARKVPREAVRAEQGVVDGPRPAAANASARRGSAFSRSITDGAEHASTTRCVRPSSKAGK